MKVTIKLSLHKEEASVRLSEKLHCFLNVSALRKRTCQHGLETVNGRKLRSVYRNSAG